MKIHLFHFNKDETSIRVEQLKALGNEVISKLPDNAQFFKLVKENPPDIFIIDLSRLPSSGRDIGIHFRTTKSTRFIPLIFVDGNPEKMARVQDQLPDAIYTTWDNIESSIKKTLENPLENPVVPASNLAGYSGTPLHKKLGIKENMIVGVANVPDKIEQILGELPSGAQLLKNEFDAASLILWFLPSKAQLEQDIVAMVDFAEHARLRMIWPKKTSALACDLTQQIVRETGLSAGLVDYKVCAVDETWSGLLFTKKKK